MQINNDSIQKVREVVDDLNDVADELIRAKERYDIAMERLAELGFNSIKESKEGALKLIDKKDKKTKKLEEDFEEFMEDYGGVLNNV